MELVKKLYDYTMENCATVKNNEINIYIQFWKYL